MDALYFRVSSERQTTENQFEDLLQVAERDGSARDWTRLRAMLSVCVEEEQVPTTGGGTRTLYRVRPELVEQLAERRLYVEQGRSGKTGAGRRPLFEQMKRDAAARKFDRLLVWKVSRLGRDMREVIATVYELADLAVTVVPIKSLTGPITSTMGKLLWAIQAWYAEMENDERSQAIRAGLERARKEGKQLGRRRRVFDQLEIVRLRDHDKLSRPQIAAKTGLGVGTVVRAYRAATVDLVPFQKLPGGEP
ncbi:MAG TPA: recombinase family protein [Bryobacteraceae bacterium]|nr:recombinase family protein [Bryobacteraceae bacterium]